MATCGFFAACGDHGGDRTIEEFPNCGTNEMILGKTSHPYLVFFRKCFSSTSSLSAKPILFKVESRTNKLSLKHFANSGSA